MYHNTVNCGHLFPNLLAAQGEQAALHSRLGGTALLCQIRRFIGETFISTGADISRRSGRPAANSAKGTNPTRTPRFVLPLQAMPH
jgi:hypothetical protein